MKPVEDTSSQIVLVLFPQLRIVLRSHERVLSTRHMRRHQTTPPNDIPQPILYPPIRAVLDRSVPPGLHVRLELVRLAHVSPELQRDLFQGDGLERDILE